MDRSEPYVGHLGGCASLPQLGSCRAVRLGPVAVAPTCRATNRQTSAQEHCDSLFRPIQKRQQHRDRRELDIHAAIPCQFLEPRPTWLAAKATVTHNRIQPRIWNRMINKYGSIVNDGLIDQTAGPLYGRESTIASTVCI